jgi:hypothetical protein
VHTPVNDLRLHATFVICIYILKLFFIQNHRTIRYSFGKNQTASPVWKQEQLKKFWVLKYTQVYIFGVLFYFEMKTAIDNKILKFSTKTTCI